MGATAASGVGLPVVLTEPGGHRLTVRRATLDDEPALAALYDRLPAEDRHRRFFTGGCPADEWIRCWLSPPGQVVVVEDENGAIVADAGYAVDKEGRADLGMLVERGHRGWLGPYLLDLVLRLAAEAGFDAVVAEVLATNHGMLALANARGYVLLPCEDFGTVRLVLGTHGVVPGWPGPHERRRVLVETPGGRNRAIDELAAAGFDVVACPGPTRRSPKWRCPVLDGRPCPLAEAADALVVNLRHDRELDVAVAAGHRDVHPHLPRFAVGPDLVAEVEAATGPGSED